MWTIAINIGIFLATYKYRRYTIFAHFLIGLGVAIITILSAFPMLLKADLSNLRPNIRIHTLIGIAIIAAIML